MLSKSGTNPVPRPTVLTILWIHDSIRGSTLLEQQGVRLDTIRDVGLSQPAI